MLCGFIIGSSAEATDSWTWTSCPGVRASCGFSCECVLLAAPFALNHVSHLISHLISYPFYHPPASFCLLLLPSPAPPPSLSLLPLIAVRLSHFAPAQSKVTPDRRLPLSPTAMLNNAAALQKDPAHSRGTSQID